MGKAFNNYIIFAADTETQTLFDDTKELQKFNDVDAMLKQQEINKERILATNDRSNVNRLKMCNQLIKIKQSQKDIYRGTLCTEIVPYMVGYVYTGWTTNGGNRMSLRHDYLIKKNDDKIKPRRKKDQREHDNETSLNQLNYFLSDNFADSAILSMFDDIVNKYQHLIDKENGNYTALIYFHNLKFDIRPILFQQFKMNPQNFGLQHDILKSAGSVYGYNFLYRGCRFELRDSYKILPEPISKLGKLVGVEKLDEADTYDWHDLSDIEAINKELRYFKNDILILKKSLDFFFNNNKRLYLTASAMSYGLAKKSIKNKKGFPQVSIFIEEFAKTKQYKDMTEAEREKYKKDFWRKYQAFNQAYYGGFVLVNQNYIGKPLAHGITYDVNSLYPYVMINRDLPNIFKTKKMSRELLQRTLKAIDELRPDYNFGVVEIAISKLNLKPNGTPCIPKKLGELSNLDKVKKPVIRLEQLKRPESVFLSVLDLYHIIKNYDIKYKMIDGFYWDKSDMLQTPLKAYLTGLKNKKERLSSDDPERLLTKLQMNSLYGKFGQKPRTDETVLENTYYYDDFKEMNYFKEGANMIIDTDKVKPSQIRNNLLAVAITAYARDVLLSTIENITESGKAVVAYCDTDSIHVYPVRELADKLDFNKSIEELQPVAKSIANELGIEYDEHRLGAWKDEQYMTRGVYLANKKYWEIDPVHDPENPNIIKFAGVSVGGRKRLQAMGFNNFATKIDTFGQFVLTNTAIALPSGVRIVERNKKVRCE